MFAANRNILEFLTDSTLRYNVRWSGPIQQGDYRLTGWLRPKAAPAVPIGLTVHFGASQAAKLKQNTGINATGGPSATSSVWMFVALAVLALLCVTMLAILLAGRRRRRKSPPSDPQPGAAS